MEDILQSLLVSASKSQVSASVVIFNIIFSCGLSLILSFMYRYTHKGLSYSQSFIMSIVYVTIITCIAMMIIGSSLVSTFALLGAFSIIRFRTPVKDVRDISYIFLALVTGMGVGTGNYEIATIGVIMMSLIIFILNKVNFGSIRKYAYILSFEFDNKKADDKVFKSLFDQYLKMQSLLHVNALKDGHTLDFTFNINFKNDNEIDEFTQKLGSQNGISSVNLLSSTNDIEY